MMTINEIKKLIYKVKPKANLQCIRMGVAYYLSEEVEDSYKFSFQVPVSDMGDADFFPEMEAKLLLRWVQEGYAVKV